MSEPGDNLARLVAAWTAMLRSGESSALAGLLDEGVVWQGLLPEMVCSDRQQVLRILGRRGSRPLRITRVEAEEFGERVAISVEGPDFAALAGEAEAPLLAAGAARSLVFTFRDGRVVRMESLPSREAAFALAAG
jgi:hypothetical protein